MLLLRQMAQYVFQLVIATPLYRRLRPEYGIDGGPQGLGTSDDEEPLLPRIESARHQILRQSSLTHDSVVADCRPPATVGDDTVVDQRSISDESTNCGPRMALAHRS